jgi:hypothetical protein
VLAEHAARRGQRRALAVEGRERLAGRRLEAAPGRERLLEARAGRGADQRGERREVGEADGGRRARS